MTPGSEAIRVLCAPDKLRGALDAADAARALALGVRDAGGVAFELPVADGGEGTLDALLAGAGDAAGAGAAAAAPRPGAARPDAPPPAAGATRVHRVTVADTLGRPRAARLGELAGGVFVVEAAEAVPLHALAESERDPARASSAGVGELIRAALDHGARRLLIAVGGTATLDGGAGLLHALGARAPRDGGELLAAFGSDAAPARVPDAEADRAPGAGPVPAREPAPLDLSTVDPRLRGVALELLSDVEAPLTGPRGTAHVFGPQKGATPAFVAALDAALARWAAALGIDPATPGAGAAGGIGAALQALGARTRPGAAAVLDDLRFDARLREERIGLCLTAEGSVDASTLQGKAVAAVVSRCTAAGVPVVVLGGRVEPEAAAELRRRGARAVDPLGPPDRPLPTALAATGDELRAAAASATRGT